MVWFNPKADKAKQKGTRPWGDFVVEFKPMAPWWGSGALV
jgi:hypothetical protein